jgi:hypothetical protein
MAKIIKLTENDVDRLVRKIINESEDDDLGWAQDIVNSEYKLPEIELSYKRYMKSFDIVDDWRNMGGGTIFHGDSGYITNYEDIIDRLKYSMGNKVENVDDIEFIDTGKYLTTFIKGYSISFY